MGDGALPMGDVVRKDIKLVANGDVTKDFVSEYARQPQQHNFIKSAGWSADGTCVITNSEDNHIRTYIIPPDLLEERTEPSTLHPYNTISSFEPVSVVVGYPYFDLQTPSTTLILSAASEHPIRLTSALTSDLVASYPLVHSPTETYIKPQSLLFSDDGSSFIAASNSLLSFFDLSRPGQEPTRSLRTGPKKSKSLWSNPGTSLRGLISAIAIDSRFSVLAAGTLSRHVGLYDSNGQGECIGVFSVAGTQADLDIGGNGITQLLWSDCGRYLYIVERKSDGAMIYDIRMSGQLLSWIRGRQARTNQRMKLDLAQESGSLPSGIWGGGTDGYLRYWNNPYTYIGEVEPSIIYQAHEDVVNSVSLHTNAAVLATTCGQRNLQQSFEDTHLSHSRQLAKDSALKIWMYE